MAAQEIVALGPAFAAYLRRFRECLGQDRTAGHFDTYGRGLLSDLPRKCLSIWNQAAGRLYRNGWHGSPGLIRFNMSRVILVYIIPSLDLLHRS